jgi:hypothetical protein
MDDQSASSLFVDTFATGLLAQPLSLLLRDFLHNLRSSLDHLAWQLVLANEGTPGKKTSFPIFSKRREYKKFKKNNDTATGMVGEVSQDAADLVEGFQPYNNKEGLPKEDKLWVLSTLNNIDKHRQFNIAVLNTSDVLQADLMTEDGTGIYMTLQVISEVPKHKPVEDGAIIGVAPFNPGPGYKVRVGVYSAVGLQETGEVGSFESRSIGTVANDLLEHVRDTVVPEFEQSFLFRTGFLRSQTVFGCGMHSQR